MRTRAHLVRLFLSINIIFRGNFQNMLWYFGQAGKNAQAHTHSLSTHLINI